MKRLSIAGLCLVSMLVMSMVAAGTASAALLWLVCLEGSGLTKYENSKCLKASGTGKWQSLGVPSGASITVKILILTLLLKDTGVPILGESEVQCFDNKGSVGEGVIEANGKGKVVKAEVLEPEINCAAKKVCEAGTVKEVKGINLPWTTEIFTTEGKQLTALKGGGAKKEPGWKIRCDAPIVGESEDRCEGGTATPEEVELLNVVTKNPGGVEELLVKGRFENKRKGTCTQSGKETGEVTGTIAILLPGGALSIAP
jgi:hypothetical protein